jgi:PAS domain-containing protein
VDAAELACTELVTNVVLHAHTTMTVTVESLTDELRVAVSDTSTELPRQRTGTEGATTGRGLLLVAQIAATHGVRRDPIGKTVWFTLRAPVPGDDDEPTAEDLLGMWEDEPDGASGALSSSRADDGGAVRAPTARRPVRLVGLPALLWLAAEEHHRTLLRELVLYQAESEGPAPETGLSAGQREDADLVAAGAAHTLLGGAVAAAVRQAQAAGQARRPLPVEHPADLPWVPSTMDLELDVASGAVADFAALQDALDLAERLAEGGRLLARPGLPEIVAVRDWACEQVLAQASGSPAGAWPGTDQERFVAQEHLPAEAGSDLDAVRSASGAVVAADDSNRIVAISPAMAHLVRWDAEQLVGRRVVTLIPAELREAHVAGFSRHLTTGQARLLGVPSCPAGPPLRRQRRPLHGHHRAGHPGRGPPAVPGPIRPVRTGGPGRRLPRRLARPDPARVTCAVYEVDSPAEPGKAGMAGVGHQGSPSLQSQARSPAMTGRRAPGNT